MQIYPAIDLRNGCCVRLYQGDYAQETRYSEDPLAVAEHYKQQGATWLHLVDLDAAKNPQHSQLNLLKKIITTSQLQVQMGGGIRNKQQVQALLDHGAARVIVGSLAIQQPDEVYQWLNYFGNERIVLALDVQLINNEAYVAQHGWQNVSAKKLFEVLEFYKNADVKHILCTDIQRDGALTGPNLNLYKMILQQFEIELQASGGMSSLADLTALRAIPVSGVIIGRALYENKFQLREALTC